MNKDIETIERLYTLLYFLDQEERTGKTTGDTQDAVASFEKFFNFLRDQPDAAKDRTDQLFKKENLHKCLTRISEDNKTHTFNINGDSLLVRAISIKRGNKSRSDRLEKIIECIITCCPRLISFEKLMEDSYEGTGVTPVHLAIFQEDIMLLKKMAIIIDNKLMTTLLTKNVDPGLQNTPMMAGTLLGMASLVFNENIFKIILKDYKSRLDVTNEKGIHYKRRTRGK